MPHDDQGLGGGELSLDACLELLANHQRRTVLQLFYDSELNHVSIDEVITEIIEAEAARTGQQPGHDSVAAAVYHVHLPKMAEAGILEYDTRNQDVRYRENEQLEALYSAIQEFE